MRISLSWLKSYVDINVSAEELAEKLTMIGLEVEKIDHLWEKYDRIVVGEVVETNKHPNADKLTVCKVNIGKEVLKIICGAPNVSAKQKVAVGLIGATVPRNQHDPNGLPFVLSQVKIRGEDSHGMICSEYELGLGNDKNGIMLLDNKANTGSNLSDYLGLNDTVLEIGITPNRPDAMSHVGIAREVAAIFNKKIKIPPIKIRESKQLAAKFAKIKIVDSKHCPRYTARLVFNLKVSTSPKWLNDYLNAVGIRPVNNVVDVTNFVLMEIGQPLHAFDYDKITNGTIIVKPGTDDEVFTTLDHKQRILRKSTLMICDAKRPLAIAGIMGGADAEITENTKNILIESAYFNAQSIRRTSKHLGLSTDASQRFERGADPNITFWAVNRAAQLIQEVSGGEILKHEIDIYPKKIPQRIVCLHTETTNKLLGTSLNVKVISKLLGKINILQTPLSKKKSYRDKVYFSIPAFRGDIEQEVDLIEEVARMYGYDNIETKMDTRITFSNHAPDSNHIGQLRDWLVGGGYSEIISNSMQETSIASIASDKVVEIANPISKEMAGLRTNLVLSMLQVMRNNIFHNNKHLRLFEVGKCYFRNSTHLSKASVQNYSEENRLILAYSGSGNKTSWDRPANTVDLYDVKGEVQTLFKKIFLDNIKFIPYSTTKALTRMGFHVEINGVQVGLIGSVRKDILTKFEIEQDVFVTELSLDLLFANLSSKRTFKPLPKYPFVTRDIAFIVNEDVAEAKVEEEIYNAGGSLVRKVELFDVYRGSQINMGQKSLAFALEFLSEDHTMTQEEIDHIMGNIISRVSRNLGGTLRD